MARSAARRPAIQESSYLFDSGGNLMKQLLVAVAIVSLASTGCVNTSQFARNNNGPARHMARSQTAQRPDGVRTVGYESGMLGSNSCSCNSCCDTCCECDCGCPEDCCCEAGCGCCDVGCCDGGCCDSGCCDVGCCDSGCCSSGCGNGGCCGCGNGDCCGNNGCGPCQRMVGQIASGFCPHSGGYPAAYNFNPGPPAGQTAYPYYTTRGPRDFLQNNPPTIGPY